MEIKYYTKSVYGNDCHYPASEDAKLVTSLTKRKTLSAEDLRILTMHGCNVERVIAP